MSVMENLNIDLKCLKDLVSFVHGVFQAEKQKRETVKKKKKKGLVKYGRERPCIK